MLPFFECCVVAVVAVGVHHTERWRKSSRAGRVKSRKGTPRAGKHAVELAAQVIIDQTHARVPIAVIARWLAQVLAEEHRIIATAFVIKERVAMIAVAKSTRAVELPLDTTKIARIARVFASS